MAGKDIFPMSRKELKRLPVIHNVITGHVTQVEASGILGLSDRHIRRLVKEVKEKGDIALAHKSRGKPSHASKPQGLKDKALNLCETKYKDFNPTFASEKLFEIDKIKVHPETLRLWFIAKGIEYKKRKAKKHRSWRPRKDSYGQMLQIDGSHHDWLEGRGPWCVLMGYIDDATGRVFARFYDYEGTMPAMDSFKRYITRYGIPQSVYLDKHSTYKSTKKLTIEEELNNVKALSQFERALKTLGVDVIHANSPQAKGRVERSFNTHQDRLTKGMRLANISTVKDANTFLGSYYMRKHNSKFAVIAKNKANLHRPIPKHLDLDRLFSIKNKATLRNDFTIQRDNKFYQILDTTRAKEVVLEERLNGKLCIYYKNTQLRYKLIDKKPQKPKALYKRRRPRYIPPKDHPYRLFKIRKAS